MIYFRIRSGKKSIGLFFPRTYEEVTKCYAKYHCTTVLLIQLSEQCKVRNVVLFLPLELPISCSVARGVRGLHLARRAPSSSQTCSLVPFHGWSAAWARQCMAIQTAPRHAPLSTLSVFIVCAPSFISTLCWDCLPNQFASYYELSPHSVSKLSPHKIS